MPATETTSSPIGLQQPMQQDLQTLIGLLGNLMPLLLRMQAQPLGPTGFYANAMLDHQAAVSLVEDIVGDSLHRLQKYIEANSKDNSSLASNSPVVELAGNCRNARDYAQAFNLIFDCYRAITALRAADSKLPPLSAIEGRTSGQTSPATHH